MAYFNVVEETQYGNSESIDIKKSEATTTTGIKLAD